MSTRFSPDLQPNFPPDLAPDSTPRRVVFMGTPQFAVPALDALAANPGIILVAVVTPPDRRQGRGRQAAPSPVKARALELGIPVIQPPTLRDADAVAALAGYAPDIIVVAAYGMLLPAAALALPRRGCLNLHPSLLPRHRGPAPVAGALLAGDAVAGVSIMLLDEGMDTGPVIARRERRIAPGDDAAILTERLFRDGAALLNEIIPQWTAGAIAAVPQDEGQATYTAKIGRGDGRADWTLPAAILCRRQRAYAPWPGLYTGWNGQELKLLDTRALPAGDDIIPPGRVSVSDADPDGIVIGTGDGLLSVGALQLAGRRAARAGDFRRGYPQIIGAQLG